MMIDATHAPNRRSWVESANGHPDFPIQNLPFGIFSPPGGGPRGGCAIGDEILDLGAALELGLFEGGAAGAAKAASAATLNAFFALGVSARAELRSTIGAILDEAGPLRARAELERARLLYPAASCRLHLPATVGDYTDFYAGIHHALNVGRQLRPNEPLMANYKYMPIGYHGRSSSIVPSDTPIRRPNGQRKRRTESVPSFGPSRNLDFELEVGIWIGPGNDLGSPFSITEAWRHIAGFCLLNDWSARDLQGWEAQPLGPFLAKSFATTVSPWVVTPEALAPFRMPNKARSEGDPELFPNLVDQEDRANGALDVALEVFLNTPALTRLGLPPHRVSASNMLHLYWTPAQLVTHQASAGCNLRPGDLVATGTVSAPSPDGLGSLLEITEGGKREIALPSGETRRFLEDGDEVLMFARCQRQGYATIGFGACRGVVVPAPQDQTYPRINVNPSH